MARSSSWHRTASSLGHDPEKWAPVFPRDKREAFARRSCSNKKIERDDESKRSHNAQWMDLGHLKGTAVGGGMRDGFVGVIEIECRELEMIELQQPRPDQADHVDGGLGR